MDGTLSETPSLNNLRQAFPKLAALITSSRDIAFRNALQSPFPEAASLRAPRSLACESVCGAEMRTHRAIPRRKADMAPHYPQRAF